MKISDLRIGDEIVSPDKKKFTVVDVCGNQATIVRAQVLTDAEGWSFAEVSKKETFAELVELRAKVKELEAKA